MPTTRKFFIQQTALALAGSCLPLSKLFAEKKLFHTNGIDSQHPMDCSKDLRNPLFTSANNLVYTDFQYHKGTYPGNIKDVIYSAENAPCAASGLPAKTCDPTDHHFYGASDPDNDISVLRYRAFYRRSSYEDPVNGHDYDNVLLPCVVLFHPGGFAECPTHLTPGLVTICQQLSARGYIAITVDYRGGRLKDTDRVCVQQQLATYRSIQDGRGAIRSIIKRNAASDKHGNRFRINENQFFIGGLSAGGIIALGIAYYQTQAKINLAYPSVVNATSLSIQQALGHVNSDYYYGEPGSDLDNPTNFPVIRGVLSCWGGIAIPKSYDGSTNPDYGVSEKDFFAGTGGQINPPMIGFQGALDDTVVFKDDGIAQDILDSVTTPFRSETSCLYAAGKFVLKDPGANNTIFVKQCGTQNMYYILKQLNRFTEMYVDCNMHHGIMDVSTDNFGVSATSETDVDIYIAIGAAIFFQTIMNVPVTSAFPPFGYRGKSLFVSSDDTSHITNQRICSQCDGAPSTDVCPIAEDPACP